MPEKKSKKPPTRAEVLAAAMNAEASALALARLVLAFKDCERYGCDFKDVQGIVAICMAGR